MNKLKFFTILAVCLFTFPIRSFAQTFPKTAVILERKQVTPTREFVLWMTSPKKNPRTPEDEIYTCPDETRGHYYSGKAGVSLIDSKTKKIINTLEIAPSDGEDTGAIDLPYLIHNGYYKVPKADKNNERKPILLDLKDFNDDGKPYEFALFDALACMGLQTTLIGYSEKQDKVIQYPITVKTAKETFESLWLDYFFSHNPVKKGFWKYQVDYRGRGGTLDEYEIRYDAAAEKFVGTLKSTEDEND